MISYKMSSCPVYLDLKVRELNRTNVVPIQRRQHAQSDEATGFLCES